MSATTSLPTAAGQRGEESIKKLPLVDDGTREVVGVVTTTYIAKYLTVHEFHPEEPRWTGAPLVATELTGPCDSLRTVVVRGSRRVAAKTCDTRGAGSHGGWGTGGIGRQRSPPLVRTAEVQK